MTTCELVQDLGYSCETLEATTGDGYVLEVDRVGGRGQQNGTTATNSTTRGSPILLVPGILAECGSWFINYPAETPGYLLADAGYDVWAMNTREIAFRSHHLRLTQQEAEYWQWSFHEIGYYDIAAAIDLVLNASGAAKLPLLVYSQGFTASLVLFSTRPEYNDKVDILMGYGPVANISHAKFPFPEVIAISDPLFLLLDPGSDSGYFHVPSLPREVTQLICGIFLGEPCSLALAITLLSSPQQLNKTRIPVILAHYPIGTSYQNLRHFVQVYREENFNMYNYGTDENNKHYGQAQPPAYPVERITVPVALFSSAGDTLADPEDVAGLVERLGPTVISNRVVPPPDFRHLDFVYGYQATDFLHKPMLETLQNRA